MLYPSQANSYVRFYFFTFLRSGIASCNFIYELPSCAYKIGRPLYEAYMNLAELFPKLNVKYKTLLPHSRIWMYELYEIIMNINTISNLYGLEDISNCTLPITQTLMIKTCIALVPNEVNRCRKTLFLTLASIHLPLVSLSSYFHNRSHW